MAEKTATGEVSSRNSQSLSAEEQGAVNRPTTWMYKKIRIGSWTAPYYASPSVQLVIVSFVCFLCPGMFNALSGMGGGGQVDPDAANKANIALYSTFAGVGFFAGTITNTVGIKAALAFGGLGYSIYVASFLSFSHTQNYGFSIFAGAFLGVCAGLLWCAQGAIMMSYPDEKNKGKFISWFWMIFNMGAVIGGLIPLGQNINTTTASTVTDGTYIGFLVLTLLGAALAFTLVKAKNVIRDDGSKVILMKSPSWKTELLGLFETFKTDPYILALFPMFFASNWFYAYHFNDINGARFNTRTRALNSVLYYLMQIVGSYLFGYALDIQHFRRTTRAWGGWVALMACTFAIWGGGLPFARTYNRADIAAAIKAQDEGVVVPQSALILDWESSNYGGPLVLYMFYGFYDAAFQTYAYWFMGSLTNNGRKLANFAGFYKGIQSAGGAVMWSLDNNHTPYINMFASCWALLAGSLLCVAPVLHFKVKDTVSLEEDLKFTDESFEDVAPTSAIKAVQAEK
ncbi:MFS general substrate transporter [Pseudovirgaria hyperparasitica]|uniref:MFS general substrate transporter n=1 Tax=Pseudovirgaria hyperparasitica TaxID=470096 RepID=A0A6A6WJB0_9PEZI|nr:MFS general substrate transporter [Pseudovirgaria hyperparasitica]KAF2761391.1 MFS general substrate transporter [Pseudovirgaria hyperparasitica]